MLADIKISLQQYASPEKAKHHLRFFKTGPGEYGEGDQFIGITVPNQRKVARQFYKILSLDEVAGLLKDPIHEYRLTALIIMVLKFERSKDLCEKEAIIHLYLTHLDYVNNWDLVDSSAPYILGPWLFDKNRDILIDLAKKDHLWSQRVAVLATFYFIKQGDFELTLQLSKMMINHPHDLMHKAIGWMLREIGNRDLAAERQFLDQHTTQMPRTMLRYAIERFDENLRQLYLKKR